MVQSDIESCCEKKAENKENRDQGKDNREIREMLRRIKNEEKRSATKGRKFRKIKIN